MIRLLTPLLCLLAFATPAVAQQASFTGTVTDSVAGTAVDGVRVELFRGTAAVAETLTDEFGRYTIAALEPGRYIAVFTRIDYRARRLPNVELSEAEPFRLDVVMVPLAFALNPVVVTAARTEQRALDASASVSTIETEEIVARTQLTTVDYVAGESAVDYAQTGLMSQEVVVRGFNNVASGALLVLTDFRYASVPSIRINVYNLMPITNEDVARVELVRGPGSAIYGPNTANGVLHFITAPPMDSPGTVVSVTGGSQSLFYGQVRHASRLGQKFGLKISAQYLNGTDWLYVDPVEESEREDAISGGADPDTLRIGAREPKSARVSGDVQFEWRPSERTSLITSVGANNLISSVDLTPLGAAQFKNADYFYAQSRLVHGRLFAQAFFNINNAGDTYLLRNGNHVVERSYMVVGQVQHGRKLGSSVNLTYGLNAQATVPRTDSTVTGRNEENDNINEAGAFLHTEAVLARSLNVVAAARVDYSNVLPSVVVSPRAALLFHPTETQTVRFTYNRAFSTPTTNNLFLDLFADSLSIPAGAPPPFGGLTLPYAVWVEGVPETGFNFRRDCSGLCMRSPLTPASLGGPESYIPVDATLLWNSLVDSLANLGIDLSGIPAPSSAEVTTDLKRLDISNGTFVRVRGVEDIPRLRPTITNTLELGYQGVLARAFMVSANVYHTWKNDFVSAERVETPNAFYDVGSLATYLQDFVPADSALVLAVLMSQLPVGTVTPEEAFDPWDIMVTYRNFGSIRFWGADFDVTAFLSRRFAVNGTYSWVSNNVFPIETGFGSVDSIPLNAPVNKGSLALLYRDERIGLNAQVRARMVESFPVNSGVYAGVVDGYAVFDASVGYQFPWRHDLLVVLSALNLLDNVHREFVGGAAIGRLVTLRLRAAL